jgi:excisionase family DNA binding protein
MEKLLLRPIEVAHMTGICRSKIYEMLASGELPQIRLGKSVRVPADALREWIAIHQVLPASMMQDDTTTSTANAPTPARTTRRISGNE